MEFLLDDEHVGLAETVDGLAQRADAVAANRAWSEGDTAPGRELWSQLAELGLTGLLVDDAHGGAGAGAIEMVVAAEALGRHAVPGPVAETLAAV
ncbi:acyl-CoA dehydrogenase family protein, partial [Gordonia sp. (in: high G+C Gram-positive bacteria)]|uniref:acyl-CoA dehydrogenase family protein n=1 Tax=Gordonia sp. (in: high G+C Gram-positive bacteria) TaxID=84139 RepID=UPI0039E67DF0